MHILWRRKRPDKSGIRPVSLDTDIPAVERLLETLPAASLLVIDPIAAYCGKTDSHKGAEVRPLFSSAHHHGAAERHRGCRYHPFQQGWHRPGRNTRTWQHRMDRRGADELGRGTRHRGPRNRLFLPIKCNLAPDVGGLSYGIVDVDGVPQIAWSDGPVTKTVDDVLAAQQGGNRSPKANEAIEWLRLFTCGWTDASSECQGTCESSRARREGTQRGQERPTHKPLRRGFGQGVRMVLVIAGCERMTPVIFCQSVILCQRVRLSESGIKPRE